MENVAMVPTGCRIRPLAATQEVTARRITDLYFIGMSLPLTLAERIELECLDEEYRKCKAVNAQDKEDASRSPPDR
ncbi:MAG: hypothetical protein Q8Q39_05970 [bacterium]|nr:hypothetical protein [bacterium]